MFKSNKNIFSLILLVNILFIISGTKAYSNNLVSFLEKECKNENGKVCFELGHKYMSGKGVKKI